MDRSLARNAPWPIGENGSRFRESCFRGDCHRREETVRRETPHRRGNVTRSMAGAAEITFQDVVSHGGWRSAKFYRVTHEMGIPEQIAEHFRRGAVFQDRGVAIHHWCDGGINRVVSAELTDKLSNLFGILRIAAHQNVNDADFDSGFAKQANPSKGACQRTW